MSSELVILATDELESTDTQDDTEPSSNDVDDDLCHTYMTDDNIEANIQNCLNSESQANEEHD